MRRAGFVNFDTREKVTLRSLIAVREAQGDKGGELSGMMARALSMVGNFALLLAQTACSSGEPSAVPATLLAPSHEAPVMQRAKASGALVYVSDAGKNFIATFNQNGKQIGQITKSLKYPSGLYVDSAHNLWVANAGNSNVVEFARGGMAPILTLSDGNKYTQDVTICPNGDIYVATLLGGITRYHGRRHHMSGSLQYYSAEFQFVTCDAAGNVFATGVVGTNGTVIAFPGGKQSGAHMLPIFSGGNLGGIKANQRGDILVANGTTVTEYTEGGTPTGRQLTTHDGWLDIVLNRAGDVIFGSDTTAEDGVSITFPGGKLLATYRGSFSSAWGIAFDPGK